MELRLRRGDVFYANLPELEDSNIQHGERPIIIVANEWALKYSPVIQYIPITTKMDKPKIPVHVELNNYSFLKPSVALVEQVGCIDKKRLLNKKGTLLESDMEKIDSALIKQFNINNVYEQKKQYGYVMAK